MASAETAEKRVFPFARVVLKADLSVLTAPERAVLYQLVKAGTVIDRLFFEQVFEKNGAARDAVNKEGSAEQRRLFQINCGPFDRLAEHKPFFGDYRKPAGANFYPADMSKEKFEEFIKSNPDQQSSFVSEFSVIRRDSRGKLQAIPYHLYFADKLQELTGYLKRAAVLTGNESFKRYLDLRARDLQSDRYFDSDCAWLEVDGSKLELVIGPYEVYEDELFNYKAAYEAFVCVNDLGESSEVEKLVSYLPELQKNLPVDARYIAAKIGELSPIRVADLVFSAGDSKAGINTIAFALPNDEKVRQLKGSKKVILKNVIRAKFDTILSSIAQRLLARETLRDVTFDAFFYHTILHELSHPLGTDYVYPQEKEQSVRLALKELYSGIEEAKADVVGQWAGNYLARKGFFPGELARQMAATQLASMFRSMRFSTTQAHGVANLIQLNFMLEEKAVIRENGRYRVDNAKYFPALCKLATIILELEGSGDYQEAAEFVSRYGLVSKELQSDLAGLAAIAVDIQPQFDSLRQLAVEFKDPELEKDYHF